MRIRRNIYCNIVRTQGPDDTIGTGIIVVAVNGKSFCAVIVAEYSVSENVSCVFAGNSFPCYDKSIFGRDLIDDYLMDAFSVSVSDLALCYIGAVRTDYLTVLQCNTVIKIRYRCLPQLAAVFCDYVRRNDLKASRAAEGCRASVIAC